VRLVEKILPTKFNIRAITISVTRFFILNMRTLLMSAKRYAVTATGGTFDIIHKGHRRLLEKAFEMSDVVIIGLTGDALAARMKKSPQNDYRKRLANLTLFLHETFPSSLFCISRLDDDFGPAVLGRKDKNAVQALVASEETAPKGQRLNEIRAERGLPPVEVVVVPMVMAEDGVRISTSRIHNSEVDQEGDIIQSGGGQTRPQTNC